MKLANRLILNYSYVLYFFLGRCPVPLQGYPSVKAIWRVNNLKLSLKCSVKREMRSVKHLRYTASPSGLRGPKPYSSKTNFVKKIAKAKSKINIYISRKLIVIIYTSTTTMIIIIIIITIIAS